jgi:uncharacterized BrkB/YihY/UPF0761 family membrane protein
MPPGLGLLDGSVPLDRPRTRWRRLMAAIMPTLRYLMLTEVHAYAFSIAANVLLSFFPFLIVSISLSRVIFDEVTTISAIDFALRDYFPDALGRFLRNNLPQRQPVEWLSIGLLMFAANGIFVPLEVALNRVWGIHTNRSLLRNQVVSLALIFACGGLALLSLGITALQQASVRGFSAGAWMSGVFVKLSTIPLTVFALYLIYRYLPNGRPPLNRVVPSAIIVGVLLEGLKYLNALVWPWFDRKLAREYGVFRYSATLIFLSFFTALLVLAGAEWAARGHRLDAKDRAR